MLVGTRFAGVVLLTAVLGGCAGSLPSALLQDNSNGGGTEIAALSDDTPPLPEKRTPAGDNAAAVADAGQSQTASPTFMGSLASLLPAAAAGPSFPAGSETAYVQADAITVYERVARQVKSCWLNRANPVLADHKFHAEASPEGEASITIYRKVEGQKLGIAAFRIRITRDGSGTVVRSENVKLPEEMKPALLTDVAGWAQGREGCVARTAAMKSASATQ